MRILGLDPSISSTGWGIINVEQNRLSYVADGFISTSNKLPLSKRLHIIHDELKKIIEQYSPDEASIEVTFLNSNPETSLKLSMARGVVFLMPSIYNIPLYEYEPNKVKKALTGASGFFRSELAKRLNLRITPQLAFEYDGSMKYGANISTILKSLDIKPEDENEDEWN